MVANAWRRKVQPLPSIVVESFPALGTTTPLQVSNDKSKAKQEGERVMKERPKDRQRQDEAVKKLDSHIGSKKRNKMRFKPLDEFTSSANMDSAQTTSMPTSCGRSTECPICAEAYTERRGRANRSCCKQELCVQCDQQGLISGKCYFCRDEQHDFPDVHTVASRHSGVSMRRR